MRQRKGVLSKSKAQRIKNFDKINKLSDEIESIQDYRKRIKLFKEAGKTVGQGIRKYKQ